jgi:adenylate cyclase
MALATIHPLLPVRSLLLAGGLAVVTVCMGLVARFGPWGESFLRWGYDGYYVYGQERTTRAPEDLMLVLVDDATLRDLGASPLQPLDRAYHVILLNHLTKGGARMVVYDIVFDAPWPDPEVDQAFAAAMQAHGNVVLSGGVLLLENAEADPRMEMTRVEVWAPTPVLRQAASAWGLASLAVDVDYGCRRLSTRLPHLQVPVYTWQAARFFHPVPPLNEQTMQQPRWIHYRYPPGTLTKVSMVQALTPGELPAEIFRDKIVFIGGQSVLGYSGTERDAFRVPLARAGQRGRFADGVSIHAAIFDNLRNGAWWHPADDFHEAMMLLAWGLLAALVQAFCRPLLAGIAAVVFSIAWCFASISFIRATGTFYAWLIPVAVQMPVAFAGSVVVQYSIEVRRRNRLKRCFSAYLSPVMVNRMVESGKEPGLDGQEMEITALFSDVEGFSSFSEVLSSPRLVQLMNRYLGAMTEVLQAGSGTLDKYIGDAVIAMFGAPLPMPDHASRACRAALQMRGALEVLRTELRREGSAWPEQVGQLRMRVGLNSGLATVGNMGSAMRFNYTMMGDMVNLAARCESAARYYGIDLLVTGETVRMARQHGNQIVFRLIDRVVVKGRSQPVDLYQIYDAAEALVETDHACLERYAVGLEAYTRGDWSTARTAFHQAVALERHVVTDSRKHPWNPSLALVQRCEALLKNPPEAGWNGVWVMSDK